MAEKDLNVHTCSLWATWCISLVCIVMSVRCECADGKRSRGRATYACQVQGEQILIFRYALCLFMHVYM